MSDESVTLTAGPNWTGPGHYHILPPPTRTMNKVVACTAFPKQHIEKTIKGGIAMIDKKVNLQELTVVLASDSGFSPGQKVYVRGDQVVPNWSKEVFTVDGKEFILVPETAIMVVTNG